MLGPRGTENLLEYLETDESVFEGPAYARGCRFVVQGRERVYEGCGMGGVCSSGSKHSRREGSRLRRGRAQVPQGGPSKA